MRTFYVRPDNDSGYGNGDGTSYENAWNGLKSVVWEALSGDPATLWVCGSPEGPGGFVTMFVEWSYLKARPEAAIEPEAKTRTNTRRESPIAV